MSPFTGWIRGRKFGEERIGVDFSIQRIQAWAMMATVRYIRKGYIPDTFRKKTELDDRAIYKG